jgi:hypothetical protein
MQEYLEADQSCGEMTSSERLQSDDVALVVILKMCTRVTTLDLDVNDHCPTRPDAFLRSQTNAFLKMQLELGHVPARSSSITMLLVPTILPLLHTLTLYNDDEFYYQGAGHKLSPYSHFLLLPHLAVFRCPGLRLGSLEGDMELKAWKSYRATDIRRYDFLPYRQQ